MKHVIIGTAGHVDHGKTTLIKTLTGIDTDRLREEQERGMTIDLGFASLTLPDGTIAGIVDVPGHERFLKNMLAGAAGMDVALMVIAADESVMPQTVEHLEILGLLDVRQGVVALTKADMVDAEWLEVVVEDVRERLKETFLANAPIIPVNSLSGKGIPELKRALMAAVSRAEPKNADVPFRLSIDRVFTRPGFGTVVTGSLVAGTMRVGDAVEILPQQIPSRVRGLQSHGKRQEAVEAGMRVAVNLAGVEKEALERGMLLAPPGVLAPTQLFDAALRLLPSAPKALVNRSRVRVYLGTAEILGRMMVLGGEAIEPGGQGYIQFRAEEPYACARGDRFVVRTYSPMRTIGGGVVLDPISKRHRRNDPAVRAALQSRERGTPDDLLATWLQGLPFGGARRDAAKGAGLSESDADAAIARLVENGEIVALEGDRLIHRASLSTATDRALHVLSEYHAAFPLRAGMPKEELRGALGRALDSRAFQALLHRWQSEGLIVSDGATVRRADFTVQLNPRQQSLLDRIATVYREAEYNVPTVEEISQAVGAPPDAVNAMIRVGLDRGLLVKITEGMYYHADTLAQAQEAVRAFVQENGSITVSQFRDLTGTSRKYAVPVMEYFDSIRFTRRSGDVRTLAGG